VQTTNLTRYGSCWWLVRRRGARTVAVQDYFAGRWCGRKDFHRDAVAGAHDAPKSQLLCRITMSCDSQEDQFATHYKQTIGLDFFMKRLELPGELHSISFVRLAQRAAQLRRNFPMTPNMCRDMPFRRGYPRGAASVGHRWTIHR
jgi:hypothetical protein